MEFLIPLMPLFGALPIAVAAVIIARIWRSSSAGASSDLESQNQELGAEVSALRDELREMQERLDFAERVMVEQRRAAPLPAPDLGTREGQV